MSHELVRYDAMCRAIAEALEVDEVKEIRDRAIALETYARQARNFEAETKAARIRLRAERRAGQLLKEMPKAKGSPGNQYTGPLDRSEGSKTLAEHGISHDQSSQWQRLADVPEERFEKLLAVGSPTTAGILADDETPVPADSVALWIWGRLTDFERKSLLNILPDTALAMMTPRMLDDVRRLAPEVAQWIEHLGEVAWRKKASN
jgi:hypothetical protein